MTKPEPPQQRPVPGRIVFPPRLDLSALWKDTPVCSQCGVEWRRRASDKHRACIRCRTGKPND